MKGFRTHYDNLKVARDAPDYVIRAAYKTLSQNFHPDKNPGNAHAAKVMAIINKSYEVLSDPTQRREHDEWIARTEAQATHQNAGSSTTSANEQIQRKSHIQNPFASLALSFFAAVKALLLWAVSYAIGIGAVIGVIAVIGFAFDTFGSKTPPPPGPKPYQTEAPLEATESIQTPSVTTCRAITTGASVLYRCAEPDGDRYTNKLPSDAVLISDSAQGTDIPASPVSNGAQTYVRPDNAPNGKPWPSSAGYVQGFPKANTSGLSSVTVDNGQNDSDVFVKLVSISGDSAYPVRQFYIPAFGTFTVNKVTAGRYDIRYMDLTTGELSRSDAMTLEENRTDEGVEYSNMTMTLYKVAGGTMHTYPLAESEF